MSEADDIFAENSSGDVYLSSGSFEAPQESIVIEETETEEEWEEEDSASRQARERIKKRQSRRMSFHPVRNNSSSESEADEIEMKRSRSEREVTVSLDSTSEEELAVESRALSPATRLSISGVRPDDLSSDEDEIIMKKSNRPRVLMIDDEDSDDGEGDDEEGNHEEGNDESNRSEPVEASMARDNVHDSFDDSLPLHSYNAESGKRDSISTKLSSTAVSEDTEESQENAIDKRSSTSIQKSIDNKLSISTKLSSTTVSEETEEFHENARLSSSIRQSIGNKLSSTVMEENKENISYQDRSSSPSIVEIHKSNSILLLSSDDEVSSNVDKPALVQPTIKSMFTKKQVSQSFYDSKMRSLGDKKATLVKMEKLTKVKDDLPDKGVALIKRMFALKHEIHSLSKEIDQMVVNESNNVRTEIQKSFESSIDTSGQILVDSRNTSVASNDSAVQPVTNYSWQDIAKTADQIQPKHTGKQGMATFETQKTLTLDRLATLHKSIETCPSEDTLAEPPKLLRIDLMHHQLHALAWMLWRERQKPRGGILADDMGLGKTLSMISLILKSIELDDPDQEQRKDSDSSTDEENGGVSAGWKAKGRQDYYAGGTLIVCPASLIRQWEGEITNRVARNSLAVSVYHGSNRDVKPRHLAKYDVVITTYNIVSRELKIERSGIFGVKWERLILDEAHVIRNHKSAMSVACCNLKGRFRWALTGTPIQNKEMDMYALMKFLRCSPFDDLNHWKKWIDNKSSGGMVRLNTIMKSIMLRRTKQQLNEKGALQGLPSKSIEVIEVRLDKDEMNVYQKVLLYSRTLFAQFLHQRAEKANDDNFAHSSRPTFAQTRQPNAAYDRVHQKLKQLHTKDEVKQHQILVLLLRLRQICCHPGLIQQMLEDDEGNFDVSSEEEASSELDLLAQLNKLKLTDTSGSAAVNSSTEEGQKELNISDQLPGNTEAISKASSKVMLRSNPVFDLVRLSSKIAKVLDLLEEKVLSGSDKAIVVSQWSSVLDIVAHHLSEKGVRFVSLTGKVPVKFRNDIVLEFNKQGSGPKIMLLSLTAGGVGLNLIGANHLLLLDLHWNPQLESQAQDRVYRVGQKKPVYIWKFMCVDTVEQAIRVLQERKLGIANEVLTGTKQTSSKLTIDDLKTLFGL
ncbi:transcription termination factor 2 [Wyeomyia smithii]|uniref:transcription termination factor 2 n=1 Tax=Wyeomyia smithii TaxID=174621 RepID=UPI0024681328|nr:transcription termination factor 2 [Wyeomyia smithii]